MIVKDVCQLEKIIAQTQTNNRPLRKLKKLITLLKQSAGAPAPYRGRPARPRSYLDFPEKERKEKPTVLKFCPVTNLK